MNHQTPLTEVAALLPARAAQLLYDQDAVVRQIVMEMVRYHLAAWEEAGVVLDPIQREAVLFTFVSVDLHRVSQILQATVRGL